MSDYRRYPYTLRQGAIWLFQGFAVPVLAFLSIALITTILMWLGNENYDLGEAYNLGRLIAMGGLFLSGGSIGLPLLFNQGLSWRTALRILGFVIAIVVLWTVSGLWLEAMN